MGHRQRQQQFTAIGVRVGPHAPLASWRELGEFLSELPAFIK
jgi:hypothetical protein